MAGDQLAVDVGTNSGRGAGTGASGPDGAERLLDGLNEQQIRAVTAPSGRVVVLAGAGSGKTRVLTRRVAWRILSGQTDPARTLVLTFTRKAASELRHRQFNLGLRDTVPAGTFHGFALTQLRERWADRRTVPPTILTAKMRLLSQVGGRRDDVDLLDVAGEVDWARARMIEPDDYHDAAAAAGRGAVGEPGFVAEVMVRYQQEKLRRRVVDFDDLLYLAIRDLRADPDYAEAIRWRHRHFYVDEFQDVNPLQHTLLDLWVGDRDDVFMVGDPRQAIYGWNGADPGLLHQAASSSQTVVDLATNYRSTSEILVAAASSLGPDVAPMTAYRGQGHAPEIVGHDTDLLEAQAIAGSLWERKRLGQTWNDMAVLVRTNAQLAVIERELVSAGIPCRLRSGAGPLGSPDVKAKLAELGRPGINLRSQLERLDSELEAHAPSTNEADTGDSSGAGTRAAADRHSNMAALSRLIHDYLAVETNPTGAGLTAWLQTFQSGDVDTRQSAVDLSTFHGAKGLEWPVVHLAGVEVGFVPIAYAKTEAQVAEERRLLYVAVTRAADHLTIHWARHRTFGTKTVERERSPWLATIDTSAPVTARRTQSATWRRHIERSRRFLGDGPTGRGTADEDHGSDDRTYRRLRAWRDTKAKASGVPGRAILDDHVLRQLAQVRPTTNAQLAVVANLGPSKLARLAPELLPLLAGADPESR